MRYRSTETVEAVQFALHHAVSLGAMVVSDDEAYRRGWPSGVYAVTLNGGRRYRIQPGEWVVSKPNGERFIMSDAEFRRKYTPEGAPAHA